MAGRKKKGDGFDDSITVPINKAKHRKYLLKKAGYGKQSDYMRDLLEKDMDREKGT